MAGTGELKTVATVSWHVPQMIVISKPVLEVGAEIKTTAARDLLWLAVTACTGLRQTARAQ